MGGPLPSTPYTPHPEPTQNSSGRAKSENHWVIYPRWRQELSKHMDPTVAHNKLRLLTRHKEDYLYPVSSDVFISTFWDEIILCENTVTFWVPFKMMANDKT